MFLEILTVEKLDTQKNWYLNLSKLSRYRNIINCVLLVCLGVIYRCKRKRIQNSIKYYFIFFNITFPWIVMWYGDFMYISGDLVMIFMCSIIINFTGLSGCHIDVNVYKTVSKPLCIYIIQLYITHHFKSFVLKLWCVMGSPMWIYGDLWVIFIF